MRQPQGLQLWPQVLLPPWSLAGRDAVGRRDAAAASLRAKGMDCGAGGSLIRGKNSLPAERSCQGQHQHHKHPTPMLTNHCNHCYPVQDPSSGSSLCKIGHPASNPLPGGIQVSAAFRGLDTVVLAWKGLHSVLQIAAYMRSMSPNISAQKRQCTAPQDSMQPGAAESDPLACLNSSGS